MTLSQAVIALNVFGNKEHLRCRINFPETLDRTIRCHCFYCFRLSAASNQKLYCKAAHSLIGHTQLLRIGPQFCIHFRREIEVHDKRDGEHHR